MMEQSLNFYTDIKKLIQLFAYLNEMVEGGIVFILYSSGVFPYFSLKTLEKLLELPNPETNAISSTGFFVVSNKFFEYSKRLSIMYCMTVCFFMSENMCDR